MHVATRRSHARAGAGLNSMETLQKQTDAENADFWDELCGTTLPQSLGIADAAHSLEAFDRAYLDFYPYLQRHLPWPDAKERKLLEIGLGYGTVGQLLFERGFEYHGLDIAEKPAETMRRRLSRLGVADAPDRVSVGSALEIPHEDGSFDCVVSIGCLHHTGDLGRAIAEVHRVLRKGGRATVMIYNRHSARQVMLRAKNRFRRDPERLRAAYDIDSTGRSAPVTEFTSKKRLRSLASCFSSVQIDVENFEDLVIWGRLRIPRRALLGNVARVAGLDLYLSATK
jgi:SAM-dependent methyltransferase